MFFLKIEFRNTLSKCLKNSLKMKKAKNLKPVQSKEVLQNFSAYVFKTK